MATEHRDEQCSPQIRINKRPAWIGKPQAHRDRAGEDRRCLFKIQHTQIINKSLKLSQWRRWDQTPCLFMVLLTKPLPFPKDEKWHKDTKGFWGPLSSETRGQNVFWGHRTAAEEDHRRESMLTGLGSRTRTRTRGPPKPHFSVNQSGVTFGRGSSLLLLTKFHPPPFPNPLSLWSYWQNRLGLNLVVTLGPRNKLLSH